MTKISPYEQHWFKNLLVVFLDKKQEIIKQTLRLAGMIIVGLSVGLILHKSFLLFMLVWVIGWFVYDANTWIKNEKTSNKLLYTIT